MARNKKKPQGRAGQKEKAQKANHSSAYLSAVEDQTPYKGGFKGFAQRSPHGASSPLQSNVRLRHQQITFVSAGTPTSTTDNEAASQKEEIRQPHVRDADEDDDDDDDIDVDDSAIQTNILTEIEVEVPQGAMEHMHLRSPAAPAYDSNDDVQVTGIDTGASEPLFMVDTVGDASLRSTTKAQPMPRAPSPARSDSSDEVVFHGRGGRTTVINDPVILPHASKQQQQRAPHVTDDLLDAIQGQLDPVSPLSRSVKASSSKPSQPQSEWAPAPDYPYWRKGKSHAHYEPPASSMLWLDNPKEKQKMSFKPQAQVQAQVQEEEHDKDAEDTIASLQADWKERVKEKKATSEAPAGTVGFEDLESPVLKSQRRGKRGRKKNNRQLRDAVVEDDEDNAGAETAYDDYMANLAAQLDNDSLGESGRSPSAFARQAQADLLGGPSLVVDGKAIAEDEVLSRDHTTDEWEDDSSSDSDMIGQDLDEISDEGPINLSDLDSSDLENELDYTIQEQWEDEEDLRERRIGQMTDEQIARLFAKQQELGICSDELVIDDGTFDSDEEEGVGDVEAARAAFSQLASSSLGRSMRSQNARKKKGGFSFPDASALADTIDQYGDSGFDIMDFDRPSLRPTKKGRKGKLPPELDGISDDELKDIMRETWDNDRAKKRDKKAEREELRREGLLGSSGKKGKADLSMKYLEGMTVPQIRDELRIFLQDEGQHSRPFPPMDKKDRKSLHEIASAFNLSSKSVGAGKKRFLTIYKTSRTVEYTDHAFNRVMAASSRGFLKVSGKGRGMGGGNPNKYRNTPRGGQGGGFSSAATGLRNGEVVGGNAAEIGKENFGHKLMEKMGWSKGMALGKDGEGMLVPVAQVMRSGKAGLG